MSDEDVLLLKAVATAFDDAGLSVTAVQLADVIAGLHRLGVGLHRDWSRVLRNYTNDEPSAGETTEGTAPP